MMNNRMCLGCNMSLENYPPDSWFCADCLEKKNAPMRAIPRRQMLSRQITANMGRKVAEYKTALFYIYKVAQCAIDNSKTISIPEKEAFRAILDMVEQALVHNQDEDEPERIK